ncbi:hypothetical protein CERZMDRAFT_102821 [Cercospora zeae-maydis SCOH1-5]|uniref:Uncharacterized protein n=1 Tax=Cercospora zeae-maydis SCOH1-5 TaxID=717836 RepID=A0A6A6F0Y1_9PEZI|nr:hypothetical protein CERZMDRAFT_102821 [Cercospora zeae-maydis SCOH1-5]
MNNYLDPTIDVTQGLFGAAIYKAVFAPEDASLDVLRQQISAGVDPFRNSFDAILEDFGHDPEDFLKSIALVKLAGSAIWTLCSPHLQQLRGRAVPDETLKYKRWNSLFEDAFRAAITLKQVTMYSDLGPFEIRWPTFGERIGVHFHRRVYDLGDRLTENAPETVLHGILPGVWRNTDDEMIAFSRSPCDSRNKQERSTVIA